MLSTTETIIRKVIQGISVKTIAIMPPPLGGIWKTTPPTVTVATMVTILPPPTAATAPPHNRINILV